MTIGELIDKLKQYSMRYGHYHEVRIYDGEDDTDYPIVQIEYDADTMDPPGPYLVIKVEKKI